VRRWGTHPYSLALFPIVQESSSKLFIHIVLSPNQQLSFWPRSQSDTGERLRKSKLRHRELCAGVRDRGGEFRIGRVRGVGLEVIKCESYYLWRWIGGKRLGDHLILRSVCQLGYEVLVAQVHHFQG
jgi:hypothetical protein